MVSGIPTYSRNDADNKILATWAAFSVSQAVRPLAHKFISPLIAGPHCKLSEPETDMFHKKLDEAIKYSGMDKQGVTVTYIPAPSVRKPKLECKDGFEQIEHGYNCAYLSGAVKQYPARTILMPEKTFAEAGFHELGHAVNYTKSYWKPVTYLNHSVRRLKPFRVASTLALYGSISENSEKKDNQELDPLQKTNNFIRNNAGKLAAVIMVPELLDEAMASVRGQKYANKVLDKKYRKTIFKNNIAGFSSYLIHAGMLALTAWSAVKIKDKLDKTLSKKG